MYLFDQCYSKNTHEHLGTYIIISIYATLPYKARQTIVSTFVLKLWLKPVLDMIPVQKNMNSLCTTKKFDDINYENDCLTAAFSPKLSMEM